MEIPAGAEDLRWLGLSKSDVTLRKGNGCGSCRKTGYRGRLGIFELMTVDENIRRQIQSRATASQIKSAAAGSGMRMLRHDGIEKIVGGITTIEEVERVTTRSTEQELFRTDSQFVAN